MVKKGEMIVRGERGSKRREGRAKSRGERAAALEGQIENQEVTLIGKKREINWLFP